MEDRVEDTDVGGNERGGKEEEGIHAHMMVM